MNVLTRAYKNKEQNSLKKDIRILSKVKKFLLFVGVMLVAMNAAIFLGTYAAGKPFEFNYIFNVVCPLICAVSSWQIAEVNTK